MDDRQISMGLLILRLGAGGMLIYGRAWERVIMIRDTSIAFPDPLGISPELSWAVTIFAEFFCSIFVMLGIVTRLTAAAPFLAMLLSALVLPSGTAWSLREVSFLYALPFFVLTFTGAGDYSFDARIVSHRPGYEV
ncbi:MAG TPA: DoxX family protein [Candidatus Limnocylindrales bacterium]|nr:DoxX family protein [Candidatus Limnocylindrales bacterium]